MQAYSINRSLNGSTVLLTGATGFVGGSLLERILRLSPGPERVFVLVRKKQGSEPRCRVDSILASPLFSGLDLRALKKVHVIPGDITVDGLGLSDHNRELLLSTCTHVFHSAASISFASQLGSAVRINLLSTRYLLRLVKMMPRIQSMVHVSTAYANCTRDSDKFLEERLYPTQMDPTSFTDMIEKMSPEEMERRSDEFVGNHPNTYTFTKQMAENLLVVERGDVPLSIVRPSIILNSLKQPFSGWVDNVNSGACGFIAGLGKGLFRTFQAEPKRVLDIIPVDMVVSTILAASIYTARNPEKVHVFHCTSSSTNTTSWAEYANQIAKACRSHPCEDAIWYPTARPRRSWLRNTVVLYIFQLIPAYILNILWQTRCPGGKHLLLNVQQKYAKGCAFSSFFATRQWSFSRRNTVMLSSALALSEKDDNPIDPNDIEWSRYFEICVLGTRRYFHKEPAVTTDRAKMQMKWLKIVATVTPFLAHLIFWYLILALLQGAVSSTVAALLSASLVLFVIWI